MNRRTRANSDPRVHFVLIPGFGGFDALGSVRYYSGITDQFHSWNSSKRAVLHYFDNLPTAAVKTRADRLKTYLAKRIGRGEILKGDEIVLIGHSTGGLDIRQLVLQLANQSEPIQIDGGVKIEALEMLPWIRRVVFVSVPHWGTNIADWVHSHPWLRQAIIRYLQAAVTGSQLYVLDEIEQRITGAAACITDADILLALRDCLREANEAYGNSGARRKAEAHEAAADLELYLRDMASDFHVIDDLTSRCPDSGPRSPAHFDDTKREEELQLWKHLGIDTRSYATAGNRPFSFKPDSSVPVWEPANPCHYPELLNSGGPAAGTDIAYRLCYRACAGGPLQWPARAGEIKRVLGPAPPKPLELWDNDGIVNTVSMLWPRGDIVVVFADHLDIVGHYQLVEAVPAGRGRKYQSYDALKSASRFHKDQGVFHELWTEIFDFCLGKSSVKRSPKVARPRVGRSFATEAANEFSRAVPY